MPRSKRATRRGCSYGAPGGRGGSAMETAFIPFASTSRHSHNGFTLEEEARNTERHHSSLGSDQRLRHTTVKFVSAGELDTSDSRDPESALAEMSLEYPPTGYVKAEFKGKLESPELETTTRSLQSTHETFGRPSSHFCVDTQAGEPIPTGLRPPRLRSASPTPSSSSEEVILFTGRDNRGRGFTRNDSSFTSPPDPTGAEVEIVDNRIPEQKGCLDQALHHRASNLKSFQNLSGSFPVNLQAIPPDNKSQTRYRPGHISSPDSADEALIADYIANIDNKDCGLLANDSFTGRELGGTHNAVWHNGTNSPTEAITPDENLPSQGEWKSPYICDFDELSTSNEVMGDLQTILSKRQRVTGIQYLVVWEDQTVDDARWVCGSTLARIGALPKINAFEAKAQLAAESVDNEEIDSSDTNDGAIDDLDDDDDEQIPRQHKIGRMTDEQIASLLAKQEQLGMGSGELLLFDDGADADEDEEEIIPRMSSSIPVLASKNVRAKGRSKRPKGDFPGAAALADAYDGFDVMDFDRPSLKTKPRGRKGKPVFDISDTDLEISMQLAWDKDRVKKKARRQEREQLRAQGLGIRNSQPNLKEKYKEGMGMHAIKIEIKNFLMGSNTTLTLPPMDKGDRKVVHEIANAFNLKSKSAGKGKNRFPVLFRTPRTSLYVEGTFAAIEARLARRFLPRMDVGAWKNSDLHKNNRRGGGNFHSAAVSYRDGDVVGGSAPELGVENKGRAMLEKMGWSTGTALGALNNKGILQPVSHIVKTTKAGLG